MMLATNADPPLESIKVLRKQKDGQMMSVEYPKNGAGGEEDQLFCLEGTGRKETKWWKHILVCFVSLSAMHSF